MSTPTNPLLQEFSGKILQAQFKHDARLVATETATRINTVDLVINGLRTQKTVLKQQTAEVDEWIVSAKRNRKDNRESLEYLNAQKILLDEQLIDTTKKLKKFQSQQQKNNAQWASTNTPRLAYERLNQNKEDMAPALINLRTQTVKDDRGQVISTVNRSGAVSDFRHSEVSLQELEDYTDLLCLSKNGLKPERAERLIKFYNLADSFESLKSPALEKLIRSIKQRAIKSYGNDIILHGRTELSPAKLQAVIKQRKNYLEIQVLQDLYAHFKSKPVAQGNTVYGRVSLLDMTKAESVNSTGFIMNEKTQALDIKSIHDSLEGKDILFDVDDKKNPQAGPYIDAWGQIHMPMSCKKGDIVKTRLTTLHFNISVQGNTRNAGFQKAINDEAIAKLEKIVQSQPDLLKDNPPPLDDFKMVLDAYSKSTSADRFEGALAAAEIIKNMGYVSINCYGGKDRTGYLAALITKQVLSRRITHLTNEKEQKSLLRKWSHQLLSDDSIAIGIVRDNAGHTVLKLRRLDLELFATYASVKGLALRINQLARAAWLFATGHRKTYEDSPGQLYNFDPE